MEETYEELHIKRKREKDYPYRYHERGKCNIVLFQMIKIFA